MTAESHSRKHYHSKFSRLSQAGFLPRRPSERPSWSDNPTYHSKLRLSLWRWHACLLSTSTASTTTVWPGWQPTTPVDGARDQRGFARRLRGGVARYQRINGIRRGGGCGQIGRRAARGRAQTARIAAPPNTPPTRAIMAHTAPALGPQPVGVMPSRSNRRRANARLSLRGTATQDLE